MRNWASRIDEGDNDKNKRLQVECGIETTPSVGTSQVILLLEGDFDYAVYDNDSGGNGRTPMHPEHDRVTFMNIQRRRLVLFSELCRAQSSTATYVIMCRDVKVCSGRQNTDDLSEQIYGDLRA
ncbi:Hypothetical predicted protein [Scomber scombrus]|uniref:Uncharacterized protein n=1 Tax=Scomber scombrus TaxID=13677 RepID=A0AAV1P3F7_SCOSC